MSASTPIGSAITPWWRTAVVYQIYIRSFADANWDGVGDIPGIRSRLTYLRGLGMDAIWITPWYPSPMKDGGYDVADYRGIDTLFGPLGEETPNRWGSVFGGAAWSRMPDDGLVPAQWYLPQDADVWYVAR